MYRQESAWWAWERDAALVPGCYLDVLQDAGGQPLLISPTAPGGPGAAVEELVGVLDGLVLIGGGDIDAHRYGQPADPRNGGTNEQRDDLEFRLLEEALRRDLPVLAICRGLQVLNVFLGGDLVQQLPDVVGTDRHQPRPGAFGPVTVVAEPGTLVHRLFGERFDVLCSHHQAVDSLGRDLEVSATSEDGVVEAVELVDHRFVVGVQWHPEENRDARLFEELVSVARGTLGRGRHLIEGRG
jgi:anthranilate synthase component 2/putative glutamine amidotransferase